MTGLSGGGSTSNHDDLSGITSADHHGKTTTLADITDADPSEIRTGTLANRPTAGTANRWYLATDGGVYYDDGAAWSQVSAVDYSNLTSTPTSTQNTGGGSGGYYEIWTGTIGSTGSATIDHYENYADGYEVFLSSTTTGNSIDITITYADGTTYTNTHSWDYDSTITANFPSGTVTQIDLNVTSGNSNNSTNTFDIHALGMPQHNHSI